MDNKSITIYVDMDGVLADFHSSVCTLFNYTHMINSPVQESRLVGEVSKRGNYYWLQDLIGRTFNECTAAIDAKGYDWWSRIQPLPWFDDLMCNIRYWEPRAEVILLSCPAAFKWSAHGKQLWAREQLPGVPYISCDSKYKSKLANRHSILIDDSQDNINMFRSAGGLAVTFPQHWNEMHELAFSSLSRLNHVNTSLHHFMNNIIPTKM